MGRLRGSKVADLASPRPKRYSMAAVCRRISVNRWAIGGFNGKQVEAKVTSITLAFDSQTDMSVGEIVFYGISLVLRNFS